MFFQLPFCSVCVQNPQIISVLERPIQHMKHPYKTREGGATVTVFVPYDCKNHCPFCINKGEYADLTGFSA